MNLHLSCLPNRKKYKQKKRKNWSLFLSEQAMGYIKQYDQR